MAEKEVGLPLFFVAWAMFTVMLYLYAHYIKLAKKSRFAALVASIVTGGVTAYIVLYT